MFANDRLVMLNVEDGEFVGLVQPIGSDQAIKSIDNKDLTVIPIDMVTLPPEHTLKNTDGPTMHSRNSSELSLASHIECSGMLYNQI